MTTEYETKAYSTIQETQLNYWSKIRHSFVAGLELTPTCNLRCIHCYMQEYESCQLLSTEQWISIIDKLYDAGVLILYMTGGEIFTRKDFADIYLHAKKKGFIIELLTNVTRLTDEILCAFQQFPPAIVSISLYGMSEETYQKVTKTHGSYQSVMQNIQRLRTSDIDLELKYIGLRENVHEFSIARDFAQSIGAKFKFNFEIFPTLQGNSDVLSHRLSNEEILQIEKENSDSIRTWASNVDKCNPYKNRDHVPLYTCNVASTLCYIDTLGFVSPCNKMRLKEHNLLTEPLHEIWQHYIDKYTSMIAPPDYPCAKCEHAVFCSPCPVINQLSTGSNIVPCAKTCELTSLRINEFSKAKYAKYRNKGGESK